MADTGEVLRVNDDSARFIRVRCPMCHRISPTCDQSIDVRRSALHDWWSEHLATFHRPAPIIERVPTPTWAEVEA